MLTLSLLMQVTGCASAGQPVSHAPVKSAADTQPPVKCLLIPFGQTRFCQISCSLRSTKAMPGKMAQGGMKLVIIIGQNRIGAAIVIGCPTGGAAGQCPCYG